MTPGTASRPSLARRQHTMTGNSGMPVSLTQAVSFGLVLLVWRPMRQFKDPIA